MNPVTKSYVALLIMVGCFGVLYPTVLHPWLKIIFGSNPKQPSEETLPFHPRDRLAFGNDKPQPGSPPRMHPNARFQDELSNRKSVSKGGMSSFLLPIYAVGIMVYLGYTLAKIWSKRNDDQNLTIEQQLAAKYARNRHALASMKKANAARFESTKKTKVSQQKHEVEKQEENSSDSESGPGNASDEEQKTVKSTLDLSKLLHSSNLDNMSFAELKALRKRLEEAEKRMNNLIKEVGSTAKSLQETKADLSQADDSANDVGNSQNLESQEGTSIAEEVVEVEKSVDTIKSGDEESIESSTARKRFVAKKQEESVADPQRLD